MECIKKCMEIKKKNLKKLFVLELKYFIQTYIFQKT